MSVGNQEVLAVNSLKVTLLNKKKSKNKVLVDNINFNVHEGECVVLLGESGSGKSMTISAITGLLGKGFKVEGEAKLENRDLLTRSEKELRSIRGTDIGMILQSPMTCFDSLFRIGNQIDETFKAHTNWDKATRYTKAIEMMTKLNLVDPEHVYKKYPHQLSGGMLQRVMIGLSMELNPKLLIADEPTTAIDKITAKEVIELFKDIKKAYGTAIVFVTHDLGVAAALADRVVVLNTGKVVDAGTFSEIVHRAKDPYTKLLIEKRTAVMKRYSLALEGKERGA
ncbi:MAG: ABC transporter ATP-binding protein [Lachnospirales bacterium]